MKKLLAIILFLGIATQSCTKLTENVYDKYAAVPFYAASTGPNIAVAAVYAQMPSYASADNGWYDQNSMSADDQVIPHRNTGDWQLDFAQFYMRENLPSLGITNTVWNFLYKSIYLSNLAIAELQGSNASAASISEVKVMRAWFYYLLIDDYGDVPFYTDNNTTTAQLKVQPRATTYAWIVSELKANIDNLSSTRGGAYYGRFNKWTGYTILAKVYLNAGVYTGTPDWANALAACKVVETGGFTLHPATATTANPLGNTYYDLFGDVCPNDETILAIYEKRLTVGNNIYALRSLTTKTGLAMFGYAGWNGTIIPADFYSKYSANTSDVRLKQFLIGPQPSGENFTLNISSLENPGAGVTEGVRNVKFYAVTPNDGSGESNDFPVYRFADILLMEAECNVQLGNAGAAKPYIDQVRVRAGLAPLTANPTLTDIYNERGIELIEEAHRRQDMIRFGTFTQAHGLVPAVGSFRTIFPIPTNALNANPNLKQNPGY
jgi:hypothetical protein